MEIMKDTNISFEKHIGNGTNENVVKFFVERPEPAMLAVTITLFAFAKAQQKGVTFSWNALKI